MISVALIGADTSRARAYAATLEKMGWPRPGGIFYGGPGPVRQAGHRAGTTQKGLWHPPLNESVDALFQRCDWPCRRLAVDSINSPLVHEAIRQTGADLLIFAGRGGEIVSSKTIALGPPLLHCHPGQLPDYRGSTIPYYCVLEGRPMAVSAIYLAPQIDAGPLIQSGSYAHPDREADFDVEFDCAMRADMLGKVLSEIKQNGKVPRGRPQNGQGKLYYVAHPLLRHLARLSLS